MSTRPGPPSWQRLPRVLAMGFGAGAVPVAPGTFGTLVAIPIYIVLSGLPPGFYLLIVLGLFVAGVGICNAAQRQFGTYDDARIVWDEFVGYLLAMFLAPPGWAWVAAGFVLFRLFDIWKPFPIRSIERAVPGGLGTMLDDAVAALYTLLVLQALVYFGPVIQQAAASTVA